MDPRLVAAVPAWLKAHVSGTRHPGFSAGKRWPALATLALALALVPVVAGCSRAGCKANVCSYQLSASRTQDLDKVVNLPDETGQLLAKWAKSQGVEKLCKYAYDEGSEGERVTESLCSTVLDAATDTDLDAFFENIQNAADSGECFGVTINISKRRLVSWGAQPCSS